MHASRDKFGVKRVVETTGEHFLFFGLHRKQQLKCVGVPETRHAICGPLVAHRRLPSCFELTGASGGYLNVA
jgi:hypothetical protein